MAQISEFEITQEIKRDPQLVVSRAIRSSDGKLVVVKALANAHPNPQAISRLENEYQLLHYLGEKNTPGIPKALDWIQQNEHYAIILEDHEEIMLSTLIAETPIEINEFLSIAIHLTKILADIHRHGVIHKDIKPQNILISQNKQQVFLLDFNLATRLPHETQAICSPETLEGTLAYMSPEQTGRTSRMIDYRTDFYSLGVTFFEMLTGQLPYKAIEPLGMVHAHLAKAIPSPRTINPLVPEMLAQITKKLMAKTAEERYQSAYGLLQDLLECQVLYLKEGKIPKFNLASKDVPARFQISQKLYGRHEEINALLNIFDEITQGQRGLFLAAGYSGIGKTTLIQQIHYPIVQEHGFYCAGKFDKMLHHKPYHAWAQAFKELIEQLLTKKEADVQKWKEKILAALGNNTQVMIDLVPELEIITGKAPELIKLEPSEAENRFYLVIQKFIQIFAKSEHPLVIFLDDLQWAGYTSIKLLNYILLKTNLKNLLIIGAYRDNEVNDQHPLMLTIKDLTEGNILLEEIIIKPLNFEETKQLISDSLYCFSQAVNELAKICFEKTQGNPFFLHQMLESLYSENLIYFEPKKGYWDWDQEKIKQKNVTSNVIDLMISRLEKLPQRTQGMLKLSSCIGNTFHIETLEKIKNSLSSFNTNESSDENIEEILFPALKEGYLIAIGNGVYRFLHDRVQDAAYALVDISQKKMIHKKIGIALLEDLTEQQVEEKILDIVNQFNAAKELMTTPAEKKQMTELNFKASQKTKIATAFEPTYYYLKIAKEYLPEDAWQNQYDFTLKIHFEAAEVAYLIAQFDEMELFCEEILKNTTDLLTIANVYEIKIHAYGHSNQQSKAINLGLEILEKLGVSLPKEPKNYHIILAAIRLKFTVMTHSVHKFADLPEMRDPLRRAAMDILIALVVPSYLSAPLLAPLIVTQMIQLSLKYGNCHHSAFAYLSGMLLLWSLNSIKTGPELSIVATKLTERYQIAQEKGLIKFIRGAFISPWVESLRNSIAILRDAYQISSDVGDLETMSYNFSCYSPYCFHAGMPLESVEKEAKAHYQIAVNVKGQQTLTILPLLLQTINNLRVPKENPTLLAGKHFNEDEVLNLDNKNYIDISNQLSLVHNFKMMLHFIFREYEESFSQIEKVNPKNFISRYAAVTYNFYTSLAILKVINNKPNKRKLLNRVYSNQRQLKIWTKYSPGNFLNKYYLVAAELDSYKKNNVSAQEFYDKSIELAEKNGFLHEKALANELAADFQLKLKHEKLARFYVEDSYYSYLKWGANSKAKQLEIYYKNFLEQNIPTTEESLVSYHPSTLHTSTLFANTLQSISSKTTSGQWFDFEAIYESMQTMTNEIILSKLVEKILKIVLENSGADNCALLLIKNDELYIECRANTLGQPQDILASIPLTSNLLVPISVVQYVKKTKKYLLLNDVEANIKFNNDEYFIKHKPRSILCIPLMHHSELQGILYLENKLASDAFTAERINLLNTISVQAAISIENARLYQSFEQFVPKEFLALLEKRHIFDIKVGDCLQKMVSVLFIDIRGFTTISERLPPEEVFKFINLYLHDMEPIIAKHSGFIDKYLGDGMMALFPNDADDALRAAIEMQQALARFNQKQPTPIKVRIGINTGNIMLGTIGSGHRMDGSAIGDTVNTSSRIMELNRYYHTNVLISEYTYNALEHPDEYRFRHISRVMLRGKIQPIHIWQIIFENPITGWPKMVAIIDDYEAGWLFFQEKKFEEAKIQFQKCLEICPEDAPSRIFLEECELYLREGAPEKWDGTTVLLGKY